jgi:hypothetical protein
MSELERRYRRLLRLLPADHRAARGEELLGLLLDLDDGRTRPSRRQVTGLIALSARLRLSALPAIGTLLFSALLVASCTASLGNLIDVYTGAALPSDLPAFTAGLPYLLTSALAQLGVAVAWVLGARRTAVVIYLALLADAARNQVANPSTDPLLAQILPLMMLLAVLAILSAAAIRRWRTPRPRLLWLTAVALAVLAWKAIGAWGRYGIAVPAPLDQRTRALLAIAVALLAAVLIRRRGWPVLVTASAAGLAAGWLLPNRLLELAFGGYSWYATIALGSVLFAGGGAWLARSLRRRPGPRATPRTAAE